jgi:hypothetical protein
MTGARSAETSFDGRVDGAASFDGRVDGRVAAFDDGVAAWTETGMRESRVSVSAMARMGFNAWLLVKVS